MAIVVNGDGNITGLTAGGLPDASITQADLAAGVVGNGPAFSVYQGTQQSVTSGVHTKIAFTVENFDTANCFDSTTNYRFTPNIAGYYQINLIMFGTGTTMAYSYTSIYKNGTSYSTTLTASQGGTNATGVNTSLIYMNGSTDYIEGYGLVSAASGAVLGNGGNSPFVIMSGYLARSA
jgi:hypothetical protein